IVHLFIFRFSKRAMRFKYTAGDFHQMYMKNNVFNWEFDKLVEGRLKKLSRVNLKEELDPRENISVISGMNGKEVFGE
ncbi:MAG: hypothetical protein QXU18_05105, partial [Thermoplasmatales archaeon]